AGERERPDPGPARRGAVEACGTCRTDVAAVSGRLPSTVLPLAPGTRWPDRRGPPPAGRTGPRNPRLGRSRPGARPGTRTCCPPGPGARPAPPRPALPVRLLEALHTR